jgi:Flp pilus assembly protein TadD
MHSISPKRPGRNEPCPCGSGRKYKACCFQAEEKFRTREAPDLSALLERARQAAAQGDFENGGFWFRQALTAKPSNAEAMAGLGQCLCWTRKRREGVGLLRQAARQLEKNFPKDRDLGKLLDLSGQLQHWGDIEAALRLAQLAVRFVPNSPVTQNNLALCLSRVNRVDEAIVACRKACEWLPDEPGCNVLLGLLNGRQGRFMEARERLVRVIELSSVPEQTARAWLELGTVLDKLGKFDKAFHAFSQAAEGHRALPENRAVSNDYIFDAIARNRAGFDRQLLTQWPADLLRQDGLPVPHFLFGFLRSGTTLTEQVLAAHPGVIASDENSLIPELTEKLAGLSGIPEDVPAGLRKIGLEEVRALRRSYWERVEEEFGREALLKCFVDKVALNSVDAGFISTVFPEAKILFALRDPRDVCLSCFMQAFSVTPGTVNLLSWEGIARQYAAVMDLWLHLRDQIQPSYLELRYEDTVSDFENTYRKAFGLLGVDWRPEVLSFHERARGRFISTPSFAAVTQPIYQNAVARWRRYEPHFEPVLPYLERFIDAFGYRLA